MRLRFATSADIGSLTALINAAFVAESFFVHGERTSEPEVAALLADSSGRFIVIDDTTPISLAGAVYVRAIDGVAHLSLLAVHPSRQRAGLGQQLVAAVEAHGRDLQCQAATLEAFNVRSELQRFYERCGYTVIDKREFSESALLKRPAHLLVMHKALAAEASRRDDIRVRRASPSDLAEIHQAYAHGRTLQLALSTSAWPGFTDEQILGEMARNHLFCIVQGPALVGVFSMVESDEAIWDERERGAHFYLHRITRAPSFEGRGLFDTLLAWAHSECRRRGRAGLRMDTWASNDTLLRYYTSRGFVLLGTKHIPADPRLSAHYHGIELALLEAETRPVAPDA
jgi:ribosomal protein S18 acetylase RimI-like enzyme